ncbi:MAG: hypothetical protein ACOYJ6_02205 [Caulobacterales bacterium]|jgi:hypothetical protein
MRAAHLFALLAVALVACASPPPPGEANAQLAASFDPAAAKTCERRGGAYQIDGGLNRYSCIISYSDAGKPCTDKADCQGACLATPGQRMGEKGAGKCAATDSVSGCNAPLNGGIVGPVLCAH